MSHTVKIYDTCIGCTQCVRACPTDVLEMVPWDGCKAGQIASSPRVEDCVGCKRCETACPTDFLSVRVYLGAETTRSLGLAYQRKVKCYQIFKNSLKFLKELKNLNTMEVLIDFCFIILYYGIIKTKNLSY